MAVVHAVYKYLALNIMQNNDMIEMFKKDKQNILMRTFNRLILFISVTQVDIITRRGFLNIIHSHVHF